MCLKVAAIFLACKKFQLNLEENQIKEKNSQRLRIITEKMTKEIKGAKNFPSMQKAVAQLLNILNMPHWASVFGEKKKTPKC